MSSLEVARNNEYFIVPAYQNDKIILTNKNYLFINILCRLIKRGKLYVSYFKTKFSYITDILSM